MTNVVRRMLLLAPLALAMAVAGPAAEAGQGQGPPREDLFELREGPGGRPLDARSARRGRRGLGPRGRAEVAAAAPTSDPSGPAAPPAAAAPAPAPAAPAPAAPAVSGPTLSDDAPEFPPVIGVVGGDQPKGPSPTPEPSSLLLMGTGLVGLYRLARRRSE